MTRAELHRRLRADGHRVRYGELSRLAERALGEPSWSRPAGAPGHRVYTELDYRLIVAWLRVTRLLGHDKFGGSRLREQAVDLLAFESHGYVWITEGEVGWSLTPPVALLTGGVAACWPVER